ncbi:MAG TPA: TraR/DksA family transcriptional regulator [Vicinamibacteria bacterium]
MARKKDAVDQERYQVLKHMLEERRLEIQQKLKSLRETIPVEAGTVRDAEEQSVDDFVQEVDFALMAMKSETLAKIDEAMQRLEDDTYGQCTECSSEIAEARLTALPFAALCRDCQEQEESRTLAEREARAFERFQKEFIPAFR